MKKVDYIYLKDLNGINFDRQNLKKIINRGKICELKDLKNYEGMYYTLNSDFTSEDNLCLILTDEHKLFKKLYPHKIQTLAQVLDEHEPVYTKLYNGKDKKTFGLFVAQPYDGKFVYVKQQLKDEPLKHSDPFEYVDLETNYLYTSNIFSKHLGYNLERLKKVISIDDVSPCHKSISEEIDKKPYAYYCSIRSKKEIYQVLEQYELTKNKRKVKIKK